MKFINRFLLRFILKSEMKRNNQVDGMSSIFYEINRFMGKNFQHYDQSSTIDMYPAFQKERPETVEDFIAHCQKDAASRFKQEKMGLDQGV